MLNLKDKIEEAAEHLRDYYETATELKKLQAMEKASKAFSSAAAILSVALIFSIVLAFVSITVALIISESTGHLYIGFLYVTGFYFLLGLILLIFKDKIISTPLRNVIIKSFFEGEEKD